MKRSAVSILGFTAAVGLTSGVGLAEKPSQTTLEAKVAALEAQVAELSGADWLTEQRATEIRSLVHDVLADADTRASLLQNGATAGWNGHPFIASSDGNFKLEFQGQLQFRFVFNNRDQSGDDDNRWGFENRRTKLKFAGHVMDPSWRYKITGAFDRNGGSFGLEDSYIEKKMDNGWSVKFGQFKGPFMHEELVSSSAQLLMERSLVNERFNQGFMQGVQFQYEGDQFRFRGMISDGINTRNTVWSAYDTEFAFTGRVDFLAMGDAFKPFKSLSSKRGSENALLIGLAGHYQVAEYGTAAGPEEEDSRITVDGTFLGDGFNLHGSFTYQDLKEADVNPWGVVLQGGYFFADNTEGFIRYEHGDSDMVSAEDLSVITFGVNQYYGKNVKASVDIGIGLDEIDSAWDSSSAGWLTDGSNQDTQVVVRTQLQLLF